MGIINNFIKYGVFSSKLRMETSSVCQLKCSKCPQDDGDMGIIGKGYLSLENFEKFIKKYPSFKTIEISNWGEVFLNPDLAGILKCAFDNGVALKAENGVNLNTAQDDVLEAVVKFGLKSMYVSLDGAQNETYKIYRKGGDLDKVIQNIKTINAYKKQYSSALPKLAWQFIPFGHNEDEIDQARSMAQELDMDFKLKLNAHSEFAPVENLEKLREEVGAATREEYAQKGKGIYKFPCYQFWFSPMINWDGKLLGCCMNMWGDFGNVFEEGLEKCIRSERYRETKKILMGAKDTGQYTPCRKCHIFSDVKKMQEKAISPRLAFWVNFGRGVVRN